MKEYIVRKTQDIMKANVGVVSEFPWDFDYKPEMHFRVVHTNDRLIVSLRTYEKTPVVWSHTRDCGICNDSCMEFFFSPSDDCSCGFFNFEVNAYPAICFHFRRPGMEKSLNIEWDLDALNIRSSLGADDTGKDYWQVDFNLPYALIQKYVPECELKDGMTMRANMYTCGRNDQPEHYGCWNRIETSRPNFHTPDYFGRFILE